MSRTEQSSTSLKQFTHHSVGSDSGAGWASGKPSVLEQEQGQSGLSKVEREREEEELDVEAQTRSRAEDITRQI